MLVSTATMVTVTAVSSGSMSRRSSQAASPAKRTGDDQGDQDGHAGRSANAVAERQQHLAAVFESDEASPGAGEGEGSVRIIVPGAEDGLSVAEVASGVAIRVYHDLRLESRDQEAPEKEENGGERGVHPRVTLM